MKDIELTVPATYQPLTIATGIRCSARRTPEKTMFIEGDKRRTFAEFCQRIDRLQAHALGEVGLQFGQHVAVVGPNCIEFLEVVVGLSEVGIASATLSHRLNAVELADICDDARAVVLFAHESCRATVASATFATVKQVIYLGDDYER
ncbi:MAG: AMP-binding protein, partial [Ilumatobacteraceae bacterium]